MADEDLLPEEEDAGTVDVLDTAEGAAEDVEQAEPETPTIEDLASEMGWRPQDEWRGDTEKWKPADQFLRSTVEINSKLNNRLKEFDSKLESIHRTNAAMTERALAEQRQRLLTERQQAFDEGDGEKFNKVDQELSKLQAQPVAQQIAPPETQAFLERNPWMNTDQEAATWAANRAEELMKQGLGPKRQLEIVEREAKGMFPEYFTQPESPKPRGVPLNKPGNRGGGKPQAKTFAALPKEAQKEALYYEGKGISREEYAKTYFDEQEA